MKPRNINPKWAQIGLSIVIFGAFNQLSAGVPPPINPATGLPFAGGALPAIPSVPTGTTNTTTVPGGITLPIPGGVIPSLPPGGLPGGVGTLPPVVGIGTNTPPMIPGGIPGPGAPPINPTTGLPIVGGSATNNFPVLPIGNSNVSTNAPPKLSPEEERRLMEQAKKVLIELSITIRREARAGNPRQQHNLAVLYTLGIGVPLDFKRAHHWFNKAALQGLSESQFNLAIAYQGGMGVRKDIVIAYKFYSLAATQGLHLAAAGRDHIAQFMSRLQIETAQRMARGFQQGIERWQEMKNLEKAGQSNVNRILGIDPNPID